MIKKIIKKQKNKGLGALLLPLAKAALSVFGSEKKKKYGKKKKNNFDKMRRSKNGRTFLACYQRTTRAHLPANIHLARPYKQRPYLKEKEDVRELLQLLPLNKGKELEIIFVLQKNS